MKFDINEKDKDGHSALWQAVNRLNLEMVKYLLDKGCERYIGKDSFKRLKEYIIYTMIEENKEEGRAILKLLKKYGVK